ncbi:unnamed protein product, partial [Symbiodinium necroappetens]
MLLSGFVLLSCVALRSTWQRSPGFASSGAASSIQGGARQHTSTSRDMIMENKIDDSKLVPSFDGKLDQYRDYRKRALLYFNSLEDAKQNLAGPRLISNLSGPAFECFRERDPADFRNPRGVLQLLAILDDRFQFSPEQDLSDRLEELFFRLRRRRGEETTSFSTRFETLMAKTEALITEEQRAERKKQQDLQRAEYRRQSLDFIVARQEYEALLTTLADGADRPEAPRPPVPPQEMPTVQPFSFPETMKGFLFLRHIGISLQTRSSLLRSSGGSLRYDRVSDLLRRTELDALVAARAQPQGQGHGFMADAATEDNDDDDDWPAEDEVEYDDFGGYVEEEESEESFEDEQEDGAVDDEYDAAMVGYLEARRKFMDLRRARGFQEPEQSSSTAKGASKHRDRDRRDDRREGRGKPTGPSRRPDFSWRERDRRKPGQQQRGRRPGTPPPTRKKGTGKTKNRGKGSRAGSSSRRGEPAGAQYLGMAVNAATTSSMTASPHDFVPEFSFAAFPVSVPPPPGLDASSTSSTGARQCGFVSRFALSSVEQFAEECLELDRSLGLVCPEQGEEQACCLVTPPGYAILDTGCTSTLVGSENERLWRAELEKRFEGINGETRASYQVRYPVRIGMGEVKLKLNSVGHYMIPLLDFPGEQSPSDRVPNDHALASAEVEPPGLKVELRDNASSPDQSASVEHTVPKYQSAWRVRAAQIGYRAKVIRRPPPQLKGGWVTVLSLDDQSLKVAVEWTRCEDCVGQQHLLHLGSVMMRVSSLKISLVVTLIRPPLTHSTPTIMPCKCLSGPDSEQMPQYAHCGSHFIESFGNATGTTWHCTVCRAKCRECKGRVARWIKSTNKIEYSHRKDCAATPVPGPSGITLLADGDLVRVSDADATIDKHGKVPYPFNVRQVALFTEKLQALKEAENGRTDIPPGPFSLTSQKETKPEIKEIKGTVSAGRMTVGTAGMAASSEGSRGYPTVQHRPQIEPHTLDDVTKVQQTVRDMLAREYQTFPTSTATDVPMAATKSIPDQVKDLEEQAAALIAQVPDQRNHSGVVRYDPDVDGFSLPQAWKAAPKEGSLFGWVMLGGKSCIARLDDRADLQLLFDAIEYQVTDPDLQKQLNALQTTLARVLGEWFYVDHCSELQGTRRFAVICSVFMLGSAIAARASFCNICAMQAPPTMAESDEDLELLSETAKVQATRPRPYKGPYYRGQAVLVYRTQLPLLENAAKPDFQESKTSRGTDIRSERPTSAELEASYDEPEGRVVIESLREEAEYEPRPQAPPTPGPSTPVPGTPAGTPRPGVETLEAPVVPVSLAPPEGGDLTPAPPVVPVETAVESTKRGDKRPHDTSDTDEMSHLRALRGPDQSQSSGNVGTATPATTVLTGAEQEHYIDSLKEVPLKSLRDGVLDRDGQTLFWSQL